MYGLPEGIDLNFFCGKELIQVAIGPYDVQLHFQESISLSVQSRIEHISKGNTKVWEQEETPPSSASSLLTLIGFSVTSARGVPDGTLTLEFSNGDKITVVDNDEGYESYQIHNGSKVIIV